MAARPDPVVYALPPESVPVKGELARCPELTSKTQRLLFYNQDVLYHQNLEILESLQEWVVSCVRQ